MLQICLPYNWINHNVKCQVFPMIPSILLGIRPPEIAMLLLSSGQQHHSKEGTPTVRLGLLSWNFVKDHLQYRNPCESIEFRNNKLIQHLAVGWGTVLEQRQLHAIMSPNHGDMGSNNFSSSMDSWPLNTEEINQLDWTDHAIDKDASTIHRYPPLSTLPAKASNLLAVLAVQHHVDPFVYEHHLEEARCHSCSPQTNSTWFVWSPELVA